MDTAYEAEMKDEILVAINDTLVEAKDAVREKLYICPECKRRLFVRGGEGTSRKKHFGGYHKAGCIKASKKSITTTSSSTDKTNIKKIVDRGYRKRNSNIRINTIFKNDNNNEEQLLFQGEAEGTSLEKKKKSEQSAAGISRTLEKKSLDFVIGIRLEEEQRFINGRFFAKKDTIEYFRENGFGGYNLILARPCENIPEHIDIKAGEHCFRDIFTDKEHDESAIYLLIRYANSEVEESVNRKIKNLKLKDAVAIMGCFAEDVGNVFYWNTYRTTVTNPACIGRRKNYLPNSDVAM